DGVEALPGRQQDDELVEEGGHPVGVAGGVGPGGLDGHLVAPHGDVHVGEGILDLAQQLIALAEETGHEVVAGNEDLYRGACHERSACDPTSGPSRSGRIAYGSPTGPGQPGGQSNGRPPRTWTWRWGTELEASGPMLNTRR